MKISKLFHWLYAILMLLPICGVFFKVGYVMLNENAFESYSGNYKYIATTNLYDYFSNRTPTEESIYGGTYYTFNDSKLATSIDGYVGGPFGYSQNGTMIYGATEFTYNNVTTSNVKTFVYFCYVPSGYKGIKLYDITFDSSVTIDSNNVLVDGVVYNPIASYTWGAWNNGTYSFISNGYTAFANSSNYHSTELTHFTFDLYFTDSSLSSVFYSSLQELDNTEFFSWAKDSFLVTPIMYIGNLFGITSPHPIFTLMSYWLAISIIWLVFDLVMYLPLLVHRWLDKGVIE